VKELSYLWLIPFFPALGCFINAVTGRRLFNRYGELPSKIIALTASWLSFGVALTAFITLLKSPSGTLLYNKAWTWIQVGHLEANFAFAIDALSGMMVLIVTFVGSLIHIYATGYMKGDPGFWRFLCYLNGFLFAMLLLVLGDNLLLMFVGWEGVGVCSYLLIGFWYQELANARAGMKAFLVNRVGDFAFLIGFFILFWGLGGNWDHQGYQIQNVFSLTFRELPQLVAAASDKTLWGLPLLTWVALFFFLGATGKSAQIPLYVWLPDAMAGPTPVSALIHAATMVTAGVYMIARLNFIYIQSPLAMTVVACVGALTALFAATIGCTQHDIKKVLAYSTVSQLGFMFIGVGVGAFWAGTYHLLTHALFKACLFLGAGSVIMAMHHEQDMRKMGGLSRFMPRTRWTYFIACLAITGFPVASGFYSKDEILWQAFNSHALLIPGYLIWAVGFLAAGLTSFYMWRSYFLTFTGTYETHTDHSTNHHSSHHTPSLKDDEHQHTTQNNDVSSHNNNASSHQTASSLNHAHHSGQHATPHEQPLAITGVLIVLAILAVLVSFLGIPKLWTHHDPILKHYLAPVFAQAEHLPKLFGPHEGHGVEWLLMSLSVMWAGMGCALAWWMYRGRKNPFPAQLVARFPRLNKIIFNKYYIDEFYKATLVRAFMGISQFNNWFDKNVVDFVVLQFAAVIRFFAWIEGMIDKHIIDACVNFIAHLTDSLGKASQKLQNGQLSLYFASLIAGCICLALFLFYFMNIYP